MEEDKEDKEEEEETQQGVMVPTAEECAICLEELCNTFPGSDKEPVASRCDPTLGHVFHRRCYDEWLSGEQAINKTCPVCRRDPRADARVERARKATLARMDQKKKYAGYGGAIGKARRLIDATKSYWNEFVRPYAWSVSTGIFVAILMLTLAVLLSARLSKTTTTLTTTTTSGDDSVVASIEKAFKKIK